MKDDLAQAVLVGDLQELGRDDLVGVDVSLIGRAT